MLNQAFNSPDLLIWTSKLAPNEFTKFYWFKCLGANGFMHVITPGKHTCIESEKLYARMKKKKTASEWPNLMLSTLNPKRVHKIRRKNSTVRYPNEKKCKVKYYKHKMKLRQQKWPRWLFLFVFVCLCVFPFIVTNLSFYLKWKTKKKYDDVYYNSSIHIFFFFLFFFPLLSCEHCTHSGIRPRTIRTSEID